MSVLSARCFHDQAAAFEHLEKVVWPNGPVCPHCGSISGRHYDLGKTRLGLRKCSDCRKQFTVKVGTVFESGHIPLNKMLQAVYLMVSGKKGISAHQLHRTLGITYKSAWFLAHRIRLAMDASAPVFDKLDGLGAIGDVDEIHAGKQETRCSGMEARCDPHPDRRELLFGLRERHEGPLPALLREAPAPVSWFLYGDRTICKAAMSDEKTKGPASYFPSIEKKYGKPISAWTALVRAKRPARHMDLVAMLKEQHGMGHGHADAIVAHTLAGEVGDAGRP